MLGIQEMTVLSYLRNKSVWTLSRNLQISPILQNPRGGNCLCLATPMVRSVCSASAMISK